jgi:hypothetical protein
MLPAWLCSEDSCIICMLFYLVGSDVRQAHDQPHASLCHELAGQWINLSTNSFKAQAQPGRPGGLCRPWPGEGPGRSWAVLSSLCCRNAAARQVPGLGPAETTIKLFVWAGISIKTIGKKNRRVGSCKMKSKVCLPSLERYTILYCPVFQVVILWLTFYF